MKKGMLFLLLFSLGCSLPFRGSSPVTYKLAVSGVDAPKSHSVELRLIVREMLAFGIVDSHKIAFTKDPIIEGSYQYAAWTETPARQLTDLFIDSLRNSKMFTSVSRIASGGVGDVQLNTELRDFVHDVAKGVTRISLGLELINLETRRVAASESFVVETPVESNNVEGAVTSLSVGSKEITKKLFEWLESLKLESMAEEKRLMISPIEAEKGLEALIPPPSDSAPSELVPAH